MRLLIVSEFPCDAPGGGPAVIRQMICDAEERGAEILWWSGRPKGGRKVVKGVTGSFCSPYPRKLYPTRRFTRLKAFLMERLWAPLAARHLAQTIRRVAPDCVWVIPHDWSIPAIGRVARGGWRVAGHAPRVHATIQDYPDVHGHIRHWGPERCERFSGMQDEIYARSDTRDATSLPMLEDLRVRTGASGSQMLHQGLEPEDFAFLENPPPATHHPQLLRIAYAGTILCEKEFALFVQALDPTRHPPLELHLYGTHSYADRPWFRKELIIEHGNLPERELVEALRSSDWGFIPMSLQDSDPRYNRFSFPTKFITYLAAGLPVIAMGHPESSVMKMACAYELGINIPAAPIPTDEFSRLLLDTGFRIRAKTEILRCAREHFDGEKMRNRLWQDLAGSSSKARRT